MSQVIYTIGYQGLHLQEFIQLVAKGNLDGVIDIRWTPISRKPGFSKNALREVLSGLDVRYHHFRDLGSPKSLRDLLHQTDDWGTFALQYRSWLTLQQRLLEQVSDMALNSRIGLLCFEASAVRCHRSLVVETLLTEYLKGFQWKDISQHGLKTLESSLWSNRIRAQA